MIILNYHYNIPLRSCKAVRFEKMFSSGNSHLIMRHGSRPESLGSLLRHPTTPLSKSQWNKNKKFIVHYEDKKSVSKSLFALKN